MVGNDCACCTNSSCASSNLTSLSVMSPVSDRVRCVLRGRASSGASVRVGNGVGSSGGLSLAITRFAGLSWS